MAQKTSAPLEYLTSWKEIAEYMRAGVRTVQRYEREFALPVRRPTGRSRGSVMATKAEIDAWVAVGPIRKTFKLLREQQSAFVKAHAVKIQDGVVEMRNLQDQMRALRLESRAAMSALLDRVSDLGLRLPSARAADFVSLPAIDLLSEDEDQSSSGLRRDGERRKARSDHRLT